MNILLNSHGKSSEFELCFVIFDGIRPKFSKHKVVVIKNANLAVVIAKILCEHVDKVSCYWVM